MTYQDNDIVKWLRGMGESTRRQTTNGYRYDEAADEIDRLRRDLEIWRRNGGDVLQRAENERLRAALESCQSWIDRWTEHTPSCDGAEVCTCGRAAVLYEAAAALNSTEQLPSGDINA